MFCKKYIEIVERWNESKESKEVSDYCKTNHIYETFIEKFRNHTVLNGITLRIAKTLQNQVEANKLNINEFYNDVRNYLKYAIIDDLFEENENVTNEEKEEIKSEENRILVYKNENDNNRENIHSCKYCEQSGHSIENCQELGKFYNPNYKKERYRYTNYKKEDYRKRYNYNNHEPNWRIQKNTRQEKVKLLVRPSSNKYSNDSENKQDLD
ncbi:hypothetical protein WICMUC_003922 [Wickerhamomyces mucosus]|uniref:Uncharacterized protein n=1 Tax=Wickerhamomyces mucosus TaxID=1378264 RepID=A0A9P8PKI8_9ASCO|nr:hypothetical protein WICMUC_003922 [Wickerhamomyces mucosus]